MKMFRIYLFVFALLFSAKTYAVHIVGYDMALINIKNQNGTPTDKYKWRVKLYRDSLGITQLPNNIMFNIFKQVNNESVAIFNCPRINTKYYLSYPPEDCAPKNSLRIELGIYESSEFIYTGFNEPLGYYVASSNCCRNTGIVNVDGNSETFGIVFTMDFPRLSSGSTRFNSSPEFKKNPLTIFCVGKPYTLNWNVVDPDGDSLVYSLAQPLDQGNTKPHNLIPYASGFNLNYNILDGVPDLTINPRTGIINFIPTKAGKYLVAFKVEEWRKINGEPVKIGSIRREYQLEAIICLDSPPVTEDDNSKKKNIVDTIFFPNDYSITFTSRDTPTDSLFMFILPNINPGENLLNPNTHNAKWGEIGNLSSGTTAENLIINGVGVLQGQFKWTPKCSSVRDKPYNFTVVVRDQTCPSPFYDSTFVTLYVKKKENIKPIFVNKYHTYPDTIKNSHFNNIPIRQYYVNAGENFQLNGDSIIKTYDKDSSQVVNMIMIPDYAHNPRIPSNLASFNVSPAPIHTTATFSWQTTCSDRNDTSYMFRIYAFDDDCKKKDTVSFNIEIFIRDQPNRKPRFASYTADSVFIREGTTDSFLVAMYDTTNIKYNKYRHIQLLTDLSDFNYMQTQGGNMIQFTKLDGFDSLKVKFTWSPNCVNLRTEPYKLYLRTIDEACPTLTSYDTVYVFVQGPYNSAPIFKDDKNISLSVLDTTIYGGDEFIFDLFAIDTNERFDSVYITLDQTSEIANPTIVSNIAYVIPASGKILHALS